MLAVIATALGLLTAVGMASWAAKTEEKAATRMGAAEEKKFERT